MVFYDKGYGVCEHCGNSGQLVAWNSCSSSLCGRLCRACAKKEAAREGKLTIKMIAWLIRLCPGAIAAMGLISKDTNPTIAGVVGLVVAIISVIVGALIKKKSVFLSWLAIIALNAALIGILILKQ